MQNSSVNSFRQKIELEKFSVDVFSEGKNKSDPASNEDRWVVNESTFSVIDGATSRIPLKFGEKSGGQFVAEIIKEVLEKTEPTLNGEALVSQITKILNERIDAFGLRDKINEVPEARPGAIFTATRIVQDEIVVTSVGDVGYRINGTQFYLETLKIDEIVILKRIKAMQKAKVDSPDISDNELLEIGKRAIENNLKEQTRNYYNNPDSEFGHGIIDGRDVPRKFIIEHEYPLNEIKTLELFSDGYFQIGEEPMIESWENTFQMVETEDPLKWQKYRAVKGSTPEQYTDDRTVLIVRKK